MHCSPPHTHTVKARVLINAFVVLGAIIYAIYYFTMATISSSYWNKGCGLKIFPDSLLGCDLNKEDEQSSSTFCEAVPVQL